jgi:Resolvase, N terminal domain
LVNDSRSRPRTLLRYVRLSDKPDETSTSLETQEQQLRQLASQHGLTVVNVHKDPGYSGALRDRPGTSLPGSTMLGKPAAATFLALHLDHVSRGSIAGRDSWMSSKVSEPMANQGMRR